MLRSTLITNDTGDYAGCVTLLINQKSKTRKPQLTPTLSIPAKHIVWMGWATNSR